MRRTYLQPLLQYVPLLQSFTIMFTIKLPLLQVGEYRTLFDYTISERFVVDLKNLNLSHLAKINPVVVRKAEVLCTVSNVSIILRVNHNYVITLQNFPFFVSSNRVNVLIYDILVWPRSKLELLYNNFPKTCWIFFCFDILVSSNNYDETIQNKNGYSLEGGKMRIRNLYFDDIVFHIILVYR